MKRTDEAIEKLTNVLEQLSVKLERQTCKMSVSSAVCEETLQTSER